MKNIVQLRCENCGYTLRYDEKQKKYICDSCDSEFLEITNAPTNQSFAVVAGVLEKYTGTSPVVVIPTGVSVIGDNCFAGMESITKVFIPSGVIKIGDNAFLGCSQLKHIRFPETLSHIGNGAFKQSGLKDLIIPSSVTVVGKEAFMECFDLEQVILPHNNTFAFVRTFKRCTALSNVDCNLNHFCLSFKPSEEARKNGDTKSTLFDAFQATPYLSAIKEKQTAKQCLICNAAIGAKGICTQCGAKHIDLSGGCYIATAVYGSYDCPPVWTLRRFRDTILAKKQLGRAFISVYYTISPILVRRFGNSQFFNRFFKKNLDRLVHLLQRRGIESSPYND